MTHGEKAYAQFVRCTWGKDAAPLLKLGKAVPTQVAPLPWPDLPGPVQAIWESVAKAVRE